MENVEKARMCIKVLEKTLCTEKCSKNISSKSLCVFSEISTPTDTDEIKHERKA